MRTYEDIKALANQKDAGFWSRLKTATQECDSFEDLLTLSTIRRRAESAQKGWNIGKSDPTLKLALVGAYSLYPFRELLQQVLFAEGIRVELWIGDYDNYVSELLESDGALYSFKPDVVVVIPSRSRHLYKGKLTDSRETVLNDAIASCGQLIDLIEKLHASTGAEFVLCNFFQPAGFDLGSFRTKILASDWNFVKLLNTELGLRAPSFIHICDLEFLAARRGLYSTEDQRAWFESKQIGAPGFLVEFAREAAYTIASVRRVMKKVLVVDLDNTLWGGVIGDDGLNGIELGDTSPRGEAFKAFQKYLLSLTDRGVVLGVCSKNDEKNAREPFERHPEMVIHLKDLVAFKANWRPKPENITEIAKELDLGLDSFVFVDDNPAEIEIVRQFLPQVATILLGPEPSEYVRQLKDSRLFEPHSITNEDSERTRQYAQRAYYRDLEAATVDMEGYLASLQMVATISPFTPIDAPRIAQLINKSNQFNLTTIRRTEGEVNAVAMDKNFAGFTMRLKDRFGDHGLIAVAIGKIEDQDLVVDTWLMSCRVLKRGIEEETLKEVVQQARVHGCERIIGTYRPTEKNGMVRDLYPRLGFAPLSKKDGVHRYILEVARFLPAKTRIELKNI